MGWQLLGGLFSEGGLKLTDKHLKVRVFYYQLWLNKLLNVLFPSLHPLFSWAQVGQPESGLAQVLTLFFKIRQHGCQNRRVVTSETPTSVVDAHSSGVRLAPKFFQPLGQVPFEKLVRFLEALVNPGEVVRETIFHLSGSLL